MKGITLIGLVTLIVTCSAIFPPSDFDDIIRYLEVLPNRISQRDLMTNLKDSADQAMDKASGLGDSAKGMASSVYDKCANIVADGIEFIGGHATSIGLGSIGDTANKVASQIRPRIYVLTY
ncbi:unnamed protein product [Psylliodes chrysocephalus]|uniref:Uncharacterized protein n=1 Tax=Psylliodes chrysocephalus TaxID=3402493 RepID=A0A9P0GCK3_9CUCU|nr:unnamed protein product [Psylliodes chrysocephala]